MKGKQFYIYEKEEKMMTYRSENNVFITVNSEIFIGGG